MEVVVKQGCAFYCSLVHLLNLLHALLPIWLASCVGGTGKSVLSKQLSRTRRRRNSRRTAKKFRATGQRSYVSNRCDTAEGVAQQFIDAQASTIAQLVDEVSKVRHENRWLSKCLFGRKSHAICEEQDGGAMCDTRDGEHAECSQRKDKHERLQHGASIPKAAPIVHEIGPTRVAAEVLVKDDVNETLSQCSLSTTVGSSSSTLLSYSSGNRCALTGTQRGDYILSLERKGMVIAVMEERAATEIAKSYLSQNSGAIASSQVQEYITALAPISDLQMVSRALSKLLTLVKNKVSLSDAEAVPVDNVWRHTSCPNEGEVDKWLRKMAKDIYAIVTLQR